MAVRSGYSDLALPLVEVKAAILEQPEFTAFNLGATQRFADWRSAVTPRLTGFDKDGHPKALIESISEELLAPFRTVPLLDAYDVYQHLMDYWVADDAGRRLSDRRRRLGGENYPHRRNRQEG